MEHEEDDADSTSCAICQRPNRNYYTYMCQKTSLLCCTACRTFFVESVRQKHFKNFKCREQKNCDLTQKRGKSLCKFCKFQTCLKVGMTEESIKPTRKFKASNNQMDATSSQKLAQPTTSQQPKIQVDEVKPNIETTSWIEMIQKNYQESSNEVNLDFDMVASIISGHQHNWIPGKHSKEVMTLIHQFPTLVLKTLEKEKSFQSLCRADQILLFNNNASLFGMYILGNYLEAPTGHDQLHGLFDSLNHTIGLKFINGQYPMDGLNRISFTVFNLGEILIPCDQHNQLYRFYDLLEVFAQSTAATNSLTINGLLLLKFIFTIDHWPYEESRQLQDINKIQTLAKDYKNLLEVAIGTDEDSPTANCVTEMCKILHSMNQLTNFQIQCSSKRRVDRSLAYRLSFDEMNWIIEITKRVKEVLGSSAVCKDSKGLIHDLESLRKGEATLETYRNLYIQKIPKNTIERQLLLIMERIEGGIHEKHKHLINFKSGFVLCHVKCAGMKTFGDQLQFFTGSAGADSSISNWTPLNCFGLLAKIDSLPSEASIKKYLQCIAMTRKFLAVQEVFSLLLLSKMTNDCPVLAELHSFANQMLSKLAQQSLAFQDCIASSQEILLELQQSLNTLEEIILSWNLLLPQISLGS